jgi:hypothetical protein
MHLPTAEKGKVLCAPVTNSRVGRSKLNDNLNTRSSAYKAQERLFSALSAGAFFILLGIVYVINLPSSLWEAIVSFFGSLTLAQVPTTGIYLPAPISPASHTVLYGAVFQLCVGLGILQVIFLVLRIMMNSPIGKTAETMGNLVYWFGAAYLVTTYLNSTTTISKWFVFWAGILIILGLSFIARAFVLLAKRK